MRGGGGPARARPRSSCRRLRKKGLVGHTQYDTTSILKLIETRFGLAPLGTRDADANGVRIESL